MQFGQLLTHLDTTQQMINNTLKDNNTLLAQVGSPASGREHRSFRSQIKLQWHNRRLLGGFGGHELSSEIQSSDEWVGDILGLKIKRESQILLPFDPSHLLTSKVWSICSNFASLRSYFFSYPHQVQQTMKENLHAIEENFSALDERMKKVSK